MTLPKAPTFSWRNYTKPTPRNVLAVAAAMRRLVAVVAGTSIVMDANKWWPLGILMAGAMLDEAKNFLATVVEDQQHESAVAELPSGKEITVTAPIDTPEEPKP